MARTRTFLLPVVVGALLPVLLVLEFLKSPAAWWVAIGAMVAAAVWTAHEAQLSWRAWQQDAGPSRQRRLLELMRYGLGLTSALGILAFAVVRRTQGNLNAVGILVLVPFASFYVALLALQIRRQSR